MNKLIPIMTSNTLPYGIASSLGYDTDWPPYYAFNGDNTIGWCHSAVSWLQYQFIYPVKVTSFDFLNKTDGVYSTTSNIKLQGSNDGITFTDIQTYSINAGSVITSDVNNNIYYSYYRIQFLGYNNTWQRGSCRCDYWQCYGDIDSRYENITFEDNPLVLTLENDISLQANFKKTGGKKYIIAS